jgi:hypothetical protein
MWGVIAGMSFLVGAILTSLVMSVVSSAVATTYVVWAECPQEIQRTRPESYTDIRNAATKLYPGGQW